MFLVVVVGLAAMGGAVVTVLDRPSRHNTNRDRLSLVLFGIAGLVIVAGLTMAVAHLV